MPTTRFGRHPATIVAAAAPAALLTVWWLRSHGASLDGALDSLAASVNSLTHALSTGHVGGLLGVLADSSGRADATGHAGAVTGATGAAAAGAGGTAMGDDPFSRGVKGSLKEKLPGFVYDGLFGDEPQKQRGQ
jgi:hypothetical protein